jgi:hypothetical protein
MHLAGSVKHLQQTPDAVSDSAGRNANCADNHGWLSEETMSALSLKLQPRRFFGCPLRQCILLLSFEAHRLRREKEIILYTCHTASDL